MSLEKVIDDKITDLLMKIDKQKLPKHVAIIMAVSYTHLTLPTMYTV